MPASKRIDVELVSRQAQSLPRLRQQQDELVRLKGQHEALLERIERTIQSTDDSKPTVTLSKLPG